MKTKIFIFSMLMTIVSQAYIYAVDDEKEDKKWSIGAFAGANVNKITGLPEMIVSEDFYTGYTLDSNYSFGFTGGILLNYRASHLFSLQPEISFSMQHGKLQYSDINDFKYDIDFKYNYLNVGIGFKFYPWKNLFLNIIPQAGFNLTPEKLAYESNGENEYGSDLDTQQLMRNVIKGRTNVSLGFGLGYQFFNMIYLDVRYCLGISDMIETMPNSYRFAENRNTANSFLFTLGYTIPVK